MTTVDTDRWVDQYEDAWSTAGIEPDLLAVCRRQLAQVSADETAAKAALLLELAAVDMELRWRPDCQGDRPQVATRSLDWYRQHLAPLGMGDAELRILAVNELEVRSRWGDRPEIESLVATQYPLESTIGRQAIEAELRNALEMRFPVLCSVIDDVDRRFRVNLKTPCIAGRRRTMDPPDKQTYYDELERCWRLVIADREDNSISRAQMMLKRTAVDKIEVVPLSAKVSCFCGDQKLPKQKPSTITITTPVPLLSCGTIALHLRRI